MNPSAICVYCGSNSGALPACTDAAARVGQTLARRGIDLIYGGGKVGLMGTLADAALHAGGRVIGIIPRDLAEKEMVHAGLTDLHVVESMHARKALMAELADGFIVLPGGAGTMDEFFEIWTWGRLGLHAKPFGLLNVAGYFDPLIHYLDHMMAQRFLKSEHRAQVLIGNDALALLDRFAAHTPTQIRKWLD